jgi:hypothetical protein
MCATDEIVSDVVSAASGRRLSCGEYLRVVVVRSDMRSSMHFPGICDFTPGKTPVLTVSEFAGKHSDRYAYALSKLEFFEFWSYNISPSKENFN